MSLVQFISCLKFTSISLVFILILSGVYKVRFDSDDFIDGIFSNIRTKKVLECNRTQWIDEKVRKSRIRTHRLPDVIGIGIQKCGTGALLSFLSAHSHIRALPGEAHFFDYDRLREKGLDFYKNMLPTAYDDELIFEKTPTYFKKGPLDLPKRMHKLIPNLKLILMVCNPVERALSHFAMMKEKERISVNDFDSYVKMTLSEKKNWNITKLSKLNSSQIITTGIYHLHIERWLNQFKESLFILNGDEFVMNPTEQMVKLQNFLNIPIVLRKEDFVKNVTSGMFCAKTCWVDEEFVETREMTCSSSSKGRTRSKKRITKYTMSNETRYFLRDFYKYHNGRFYRSIGQNYFW